MVQAGLVPAVDSSKKKFVFDGTSPCVFYNNPAKLSVDNDTVRERE
jgi:hypothetical protein